MKAAQNSRSGRVRRAVATLAVATTIATGGAIAAHAATQYVGGGTWNYGTGDGRVWSNYYHGSSCHGASVQGASFVRVTGVPGGYWARASAPDRWLVVDHSYYHKC